jgi:hypothetical protein
MARSGEAVPLHPRFNGTCKVNRDTREEIGMYGMIQQEAWRHRPEEIRQKVAAIRLEKTLRANREGRFHLMGDAKWELARYGGSSASASAVPIRASGD